MNVNLKNIIEGSGRVGPISPISVTTAFTQTIIYKLNFRFCVYILKE